MLNFSNRQTTLDLNGPILSIVQQPSSTEIRNAGVATFVGIVTTLFTEQIPSNTPTNSGILTQRWYVDGYGPLTDGSIVALGITVVGSATTTLTISGAISPTANNLSFFMRPDYIPSAYSQPVGSTVVAGTARSTGNANNEPFDTSIATLTVYPTIQIISQPSNATVSQDRFASFYVNAILSDTTQGNLSYSWKVNGSIVSDSSNVTGSLTPNLIIKSTTIGISTIQCTITHPTSGDSPLTSNVVNLEIVPARQIITIENILTPSSATSGDYNIYDYKELSFGSAPINIIKSTATEISLFASEVDINIEMELHGTVGSSYESNRGGNGGYSKIRFTMYKDEEYVFAGLGAPTGPAIFLYRKSALIASIGNGGSASSNGRGGDGGGVLQGGENGQGRNGGNGGQYIAPGTLTFPGIFGSLSGALAGLQSGDSVASVPFGGKVLPCGRGNGSVSPCTDLGRTQFLWGQSIPVPGTALINRGYKQGYGIRNTPGRGSGGGNGGGGATGGDGGTSGGAGGGGGGYTNGSVTVIESIRGGSQYSTATVIMRLVSDNVVFTVSREAAFENFITFAKVSGSGVNGMSFGPNGATIEYNISPGAVYQLTGATGSIRFFGNQTIGLDDSAGDGDFNDIAVSCATGSFYQSGGGIFYSR
jgi:hypothetical protein